MRTKRAGDRSDQPDLLELRLDDVLVERLHDVLIGPGMQRAGDVSDIILGRAEHHLRPISIRQPAQHPEELVAVHLRHVPVEQNGLRHLSPADVERLLAVLGFENLELEPFENSPRHLSDDARIVNNQTGLHHNLARFRAGRTRSALSTLHFTLRTRRATASSTRSTSRMTRSFPSSRCTPADTRARRSSRLTGLSSRLAAGSFSTSPISSISRPWDSPLCS